MALNADETSEVYDIFGIPENGSSYVAYGIATIYGPFGQSFSHSALVTQLNTLLTALTASQLTRVRVLLVQWDAITSTSPLKIVKSAAGSEGTIVDYKAERHAIRKALSRLIGFAVPHGGFDVEQGRASSGISR